jgi:antitoxin (DNA-binding transcriptional repressor) of toxin-antitoxin stability system
MGVDLSAVQAVRDGHRGNLTRTKGVVVVDVAALRKSWARRGQASYWVELLHDPQSGLYQTHRRWSFKNREGELVEGSTFKGAPTKSGPEAAEVYCAFVREQLEEKDYFIDEYQRLSTSPVKETWLAAKATTVTQPKTRRQPKRKARLIQRRGEKDWW